MWIFEYFSFRLFGSIRIWAVRYNVLWHIFFVSSSAFIFFCSVLFVKESHRAFMGLFGLVSYFISSVCYVYFLQHYIIQSTSLLGVLWDVDQRIWFWFSLYSIATFLLFCVCRIFSWMSVFCAFYQSHRIRREKIIDKQRKTRKKKKKKKKCTLSVCLSVQFLLFPLLSDLRWMMPLSRTDKKTQRYLYTTRLTAKNHSLLFSFNFWCIICYQKLNCTHR